MSSFSNTAKTEICGAIRSDADRRAFLAGCLMTARHGTGGAVLHTECTAIAAIMPKLLASVKTPFTVDTEYRTRTNKPAVWEYTLSALPETGFSAEDIPQHPLILSGLFSLCGSVTDPNSGYHLELVLADADFAVRLQKILAEMVPPLAMKTAQRNQYTVLYLKHNEQISDALMLMGAQNSAFSLMNLYAEKNLRSQTNRRMNCDLANIDKTVAAGEQQIRDIALIRETMGLDALPEDLQEIARVRLDAPESTLSELGAMLHPPLSRSGVHHRLARIAKIAQKMRTQP
ncbi:MAG: DNA-binding protein WhiA [Oscillospiraceae bacterium]|nr:DNA-binding protein WhiA [Oscillospiraceae bacterium]